MKKYAILFFEDQVSTINKLTKSLFSFCTLIIMTNSGQVNNILIELILWGYEIIYNLDVDNVYIDWSNSLEKIFILN